MSQDMTKAEILQKVADGELELKAAVSRFAALSCLPEMLIERTLWKLAAGELDVDTASKLLAELLHPSPDAVKKEENQRRPEEGEATAHIVCAARYADSGDNDKEIADCSEAIRLKPDYADAYLMRGSAYVRKGRYNEAIADFDRAIELEPENVGAYCKRGLAHLLKDDDGKAIADFNCAIRLDPEDRNSLWRRYIGYRRSAYLKYALHNMGKAPCDDVVAYWSQAIELDPTFDAQGMRAADRAFALSLRRGGHLGCTETDSAHDFLASAYGIRASEHIAKAEHDKAIVDCFNTVRIGLLRSKAYGDAAASGVNEYLYVRRGLRSLRRGDLEQAVKWFDKATWWRPADSAPDSAALRYRGVAGRRLGDDEAKKDLHEARWLDSRFHPNSNVRRGLRRLRKGDLEEATKYFDEAIRLDREESAAYYYRAVTCRRLGNHEGAKEDFHEACRLDSDLHGNLQVRRGLCCLRTGDLEEAIKYFDEAICPDCQDPAVYYYRGVAFRRLGRSDEASEDFDKAGWLDEAYRLGEDEAREFDEAEDDSDEPEVVFGDAVWRDPADDDFYRWLACLCSGRYDEAIADIDERLRRQPQDAAARVCRGIVSIGKSNFDAAIADVDEAIRLDPRDVAAHFCRGVAHGGKGYYDAAIADFNEAIRLNAQDVVADIASLESDNGYAIAKFERDVELDPENAAAYCCRAIACLGKTKIQADADFEEAKRRGYPATWWKPASTAPAKEPDWGRINDALSQQADADSGEAENGKPALVAPWKRIRPADADSVENDGDGAPATGAEAAEGPPNRPVEQQDKMPWEV